MPKWMQWVIDRLRPIRLNNNAEKAIQMGVVKGNVTVINVYYFSPQSAANGTSLTRRNRLEVRSQRRKSREERT